MEWLYYLLEANLYLLLFYGFYRLLLAKTTFYSSNRYYLLISSIAAFILPITQLGFLNPTPIVDNEMFPQPILYTAEQLANITVTNTAATIDYTSYFYPIYLFIAFCFTIKLVFSLLKIIRLWLKAKKQSNGNVTLVELNEEKSAFSFFNLLFIHPHLAGTKAVLRHEMVHIKQKHSVDILFFEIIQIICWFNPIIYFLRKDIKLVHEYIADELSTNTEMQKHEYAMFLIENSFGIMSTALTNQIFNQSILKRRINMLNKKRTAGWARLRLLLVLPLAGAMLCASTMAFTKDYGYLDLLPKESSFQEPMTIAEYEALSVKKGFHSPSYTYDENNIYKSLEKRLIVVNGVAIKDNNKYNGTGNADKVIFLSAKNAIAKYGTKAKYGAVEIYGKKSKLTFPQVYTIADTSSFPAPTLDKTPLPPPLKTVVKFPTPIVKEDPPFFKPKVQNHYYQEFRLDRKTGKPKRANNMYIIVNGTPYENQDKFHGAENTESVTILNGKEATKKYGEKGKYRAVEITGVDIKFMNDLPEPPPPPKRDQVKFPPPIVKPDQKNKKRPPAVEPPPPGYRPKRDQVKFPPPIVKQDTSKVN